jgi:hypothetical protein
MSVMCEAISVIVRVDVLERSYPGGVAGYEAACPNATFCRDDELTRVGFMHPDDARAFIAGVEATAALTALDGDEFADLAVVDQFEGVTMTCRWLQWDVMDGVTRAWLRGSEPGVLATPAGWSGPTMIKWDLDESGNARASVPDGVDLDPADPSGFIATDAPMASNMANELRRVASREPPQAPASTHLANFTQRLRDRRRNRDAMGALKVCTEWTEAHPNSAEAWYELGVVATSIHRMDLAEEAWRKAVQLVPKHEKALANLGGVILDQGRPREAREWLERALALDPRDPVALLFLGKSLLTSGDHDEAQALIIEGLREARVRRMQGVAIDASKVLDDLRHRQEDDEGACDESPQVAAPEGDTPARTPTPVMQEPKADPEDEATSDSLRQEPPLSSPGSAATGRKSRGRWAGAVAGVLLVAWVLNGGFAFVPNHPEITFDATRNDLSQEGFSAMLDEACSKPPLWSRAFKKPPSEITIHATNQLGEKARLVLQCKDGRVDPDDEGSILEP